MSVLKRWTGSTWEEVGSGGISTTTVAKIESQTSAPANPAVNDIWIDKNSYPSTLGSLVIVDQTLSVAAASVTFSGLDSNSHGFGYDIFISATQSSAGSNWGAVAIGVAGSALDETAANYANQEALMGGSSVSSFYTNNSNSAILSTGTGVACHNTISLTCKSNLFHFMNITHDTQNLGGAAGILFKHLYYKNSCSNVTSIKFSAGAGNFAVGTYFQIKRRT